jgi:hypothetical protein
MPFGHAIKVPATWPNVRLQRLGVGRTLQVVFLGRRDARARAELANRAGIPDGELHRRLPVAEQHEGVSTSRHGPHADVVDFRAVAFAQVCHPKEEHRVREQLQLMANAGAVGAWQITGERGRQGA